MYNRLDVIRDGARRLLSAARSLKRRQVRLGDTFRREPLINHRCDIGIIGILQNEERSLDHWRAIRNCHTQLDFRTPAETLLASSV